MAACTLACAGHMSSRATRGSIWVKVAMAKPTASTQQGMQRPPQHSSHPSTSAAAAGDDQPDISLSRRLLGTDQQWMKRQVVLEDGCVSAATLNDLCGNFFFPCTTFLLGTQLLKWDVSKKDQLLRIDLEALGDAGTSPENALELQGSGMCHDRQPLAMRVHAILRVHQVTATVGPFCA
jgi:hypothetical protein